MNERRLLTYNGIVIGDTPSHEWIKLRLQRNVTPTISPSVPFSSSRLPFKLIYAPVGVPHTSQLIWLDTNKHCAPRYQRRFITGSQSARERSQTTLLFYLLSPGTTINFLPMRSECIIRGAVTYWDRGRKDESIIPFHIRNHNWGGQLSKAWVTGAYVRLFSHSVSVLNSLMVGSWTKTHVEPLAIFPQPRGGYLPS